MNHTTSQTTTVMLTVASINNFLPIPGWESYNVNQMIIAVDNFDPVTQEPIFDTQFSVQDIEQYNLEFILTRNGESRSTLYTDFDGGSSLTRPLEFSDGSIVSVTSVFLGDDTTNYVFRFPEGTSLIAGDRVEVRRVSKFPVIVRCGVIRSFGDFLVAGNLTETELVATTEPGEDTVFTPGEIIRNLSGVVRTSDVAPPGAIPTNWNPFAIGVSTADEFVLTSTGVVQDMLELQGNLYIYSNTAISVMRQTGNVAVPLAVQPVTENYGCQTTEAVIEFDGRHFVVGSQDIYIFGGHPGSIQSVADQRVRRYFFDRLNPLHNVRMFTIRYAQRDEIWICYPSTASIQGECDEALIWNYRQNNWTKRTLDSVVSGDLGPVPGGGLPQSITDITGVTGERSSVTGGNAAILEYTDPTDTEEALPLNDGQQTVATITMPQLTNEQIFRATTAGFQFQLGEMFDTGPVFDVLADGRTELTEGISMSFHLLNERLGDRNGNFPFIHLPRFLKVDRDWEFGRVYYAGERVLSNGVVYMVPLDIPGGRIPTTFYDPRSEAFIYTDVDTNFVYDNTDDINLDNLRPDNNPQYYTPLVEESARTLADVTRLVIEFFNSEDVPEEFRALYGVEAVADEPAGILIRTLGVSGRTYTNPVTGEEGIYPVFQGATFEFDEVTNGGNDDHMFEPVSEAIEGLAPVLQLTTDEIMYAPLDLMDIEGTGRYTDQFTGRVQEVNIALTGNFDVATGATSLAGLISDTFANDSRWSSTSTDNVATITSVENNRFDFTNVGMYSNFARDSAGEEIVLTLPTLEVTQQGRRPSDGTQLEAGTNTDIVEFPVFRVTPPPGHDVGMELRPPVYIQATGGGTKAQVLDTIAAEAVSAMFNYMDQDGFTNWSYDATANQFTTVLDPEPIMGNARNTPAERTVLGQFMMEFVAPGNTGFVNDMEYSTTAVTTTEVTAGEYSINNTPTYLGMLVSNPALESGFEFLVSRVPNDINAMSLSDREVIRDSFSEDIAQAFPRLSITNIDVGRVGWRVSTS